jgi:hypothetical protein
MSTSNKNNRKQNVNEDYVQERKIWTRNFLLSILIHLLIVVALLVFYNVNSGKARINPDFLYVETKKIIKEHFTSNQEIKENNLENSKKERLPKNDKDFASQFITYSDIKADTTNLDQLYKEPTLNLSIKYPRGWTFIDQNKNKILDGVTFWDINTSINPPPYIHLDVVDKYLFNEKKYKFKLKLNDCIAFYNDPEEIAGQVTQIFYLRTDEDEDYQIKLIINGLQEFDSFQPRFLAMLKSFHFGNSLF